MTLKIEKTETPNGYRQHPKTTMKVGLDPYRVTFIIEGPLNKRFRRTLGLAVFRTLKPLLRARLANFTHSDTNSIPRGDEFKRHFTLAQSVGTETPQATRGYEIRMRRLRLGLTQREFGALAGLSPKHLSRVEQAHHDSYAATLERIEKTLSRLESELEQSENN